MSKNILEVNGLKKYFSAGRGRVLKAVDDVSFTIEKGKTMGLVGESGCGKTTVGRTILRLYPIDDGSVVFDGIDIKKADKQTSKQLTRRMQMIFQDPYASLDPRFTVGDIIGEGLDIHKLCTTKEQRKARIDELLGLVGLNSEHANRFPHEFSGGQRQRVGIARALAVNPDFVVCDEAISALDVSIQAQIINLLVKLQKEFGLTYLFIAHDLSMVRHISDTVAVMYLGVVVEQGVTEEVFKNPRHPYTQGLLESVPLADPFYEQSREHVTLRGEVPSPINPKPGCRFAARCERVMPICSQEGPKLRSLGDGHMISCHAEV